MMKKVLIPTIICCMLQIMAVPCHATTFSAEVPLTGDVTSIVALALAGVAALGGLLLRKAK